PLPGSCGAFGGSLLWQQREGALRGAHSHLRSMRQGGCPFKVAGRRTLSAYTLAPRRSLSIKLTPHRTRSATPAYITQFVTTEQNVIKIPSGVVRHPTVSTMAVGHIMYFTFVWPTFKTPDTPNHVSIRTPPHTINPQTAPTAAIRLTIPLTSRCSRVPM